MYLEIYKKKFTKIMQKKGPPPQTNAIPWSLLQSVGFFLSTLSRIK